jgi:hypothetical protein
MSVREKNQKGRNIPLILSMDESVKRQMTLRLHLPPRARRSPWPNFTEARDDDDLIQVNDVA